MKTVISKDGTRIAFDESGQGPALILVAGALQYRAFDQGTKDLADMLSKHFTVLNYDRRGRGDSGDTLPFAVEREIEDIDALITYAGGSAYLFGMSSGAALTMEAAIELGSSKVTKIAMYEAPYNDDEPARKGWAAYRAKLDEYVAAGRGGDAVILFMQLVGMPDEHVEGMRHSEIFPVFEAVGHTLAYDAAVLGAESAIPTERAALVKVPALVMNGSATYPFMAVAADTLAKIMPQGQYRVLPDQTHEVQPAAIAPVLIEFFTAPVPVR